MNYSRQSMAVSAIAVILGWGTWATPLLATQADAFPNRDSLQALQLAFLSCARENTAASCTMAVQRADPLLDHPRLPSRCKDLIWELMQQAQSSAENTYRRRQAISQPAERLLLVCRSAESPAAPSSDAQR